MDKLRQRGLSATDLLPLPRVAGREPPPRFVLQNGEQKRVLPHMRDLVSEVRKFGEKGLVITRFKGLGEMDADELWETTLDPARRTLLRVRLDDDCAGTKCAVAAASGCCSSPRRVGVVGPEERPLLSGQGSGFRSDALAAPPAG
jgi:DNA gyrase/topoisomerase IV subunit B